MNSFFKNMDQDTYSQIFDNDQFETFKEKYQNDIEDNIEAIVTDMDLILEGVNAPKKDPYAEMGLMILEFNAPSFRYSANYKELDYLSRIKELKEYYYSKGISNEQMLEMISNFKKGKSK